MQEASPNRYCVYKEESIRIAESDLIFCYDDGSRLGVTWWKKAFTRAMDTAEKTEKAYTDWKERNKTPHSLIKLIQQAVEKHKKGRS